MLKKSSLLLLAGVATIVAQIPDISGERVRAHVKFLASDLLEGRGVGTRGEKLATEYIASQFALIGAKPAGDQGTYFQRVPMVGASSDRSVRRRGDLRRPWNRRARVQMGRFQRCRRERQGTGAVHQRAAFGRP